MRIVQAGIASLLVIAFVAALPGLYHRTESGPRKDSTDTNRNTVSAGARDLDLKTIQDLSKPDPDPAELPRTTVSIERLRGEAKNRAKRRLMVDINQAGKSRLRTITGVGESMAGDIIEYRNQNGPISSLSELENIRGVGPATSKKIARQIVIDGRMPDVAPAPSESDNGAEPSLSININTADESELTRLDGIGSVTAQNIIEYREQNGSLEDIGELTNVSGIGSATVEKLRANTTL